MLYLDEQVSHGLIDVMQDEGIDTTTVNLLGHKGQSDAFQLLRAAELGRVVVTHNVAEFDLLHEAWLAWSDAWQAQRQSNHAGILVMHPSKSITPVDLGYAILVILRSVDVTTNRLFSWDRQSGWQEYRDRLFFFQTL